MGIIRAGSKPLVSPGNRLRSASAAPAFSKHNNVTLELLVPLEGTASVDERDGVVEVLAVGGGSEPIELPAGKS